MTKWTRLGIGALLCAAVGVVYAPVVGFPFVDYDDPNYITANPHLQNGLGLEALRWAFGSVGYASNWHPVTWLSHALDVSLFGFAPAGHHATSILLHALNACLIYALLRAATGREGRSALVAALFALHPLRVESVAWVAERKDLLSACFGLLVIGAWCRYVRRGGRARYGLVAALQALALMSKPMLVTLPGVLLLLDVWPLRRTQGADARSWRFLVLEKLPLMALSAASCVVTLVAQRSGMAMEIGAHVPFTARLANACVSYVRYLASSFWPTDLAVLYAHPYLPGGRPWAAWQIAGSLALLAAISAGVGRARRPAVVVGWLWFLGTLVPVIGFVQVGFQAMADRYSYFPSIGLCLAVVWAAGDALEALARSPRLAIRIGAGLAAVAIALLMFGSRMQTRVWHSSLELYTRAMQREPASPIAFLNRANTHAAAGDLRAALDDFAGALARDPRLEQAYNNRGLLYMRLHDFARARADFDRTLELNPRAIEVYVNRAELFLLTHELARAEADYAAALAIAPSVPAYVGRAQLRLEQGDCSAAQASDEQALALDPDSADAHKSLAWALATCARPELRDGPRAVAHATRACELSRWRDVTCVGVLAAARAETGDFATAQRLVHEALARAGSQAPPFLRELLADFAAGRPYRLPAS